MQEVGFNRAFKAYVYSSDLAPFDFHFKNEKLCQSWVRTLYYMNLNGLR